jgi:hypothetical protein
MTTAPETSRTCQGTRWTQPRVDHRRRELFCVSVARRVQSCQGHQYGRGCDEGTIKLVCRLYYTDRTKLVKKEWIADGKVNMDRLPVETTK